MRKILWKIYDQLYRIGSENPDLRYELWDICDALMEIMKRYE